MAKRLAISTGDPISVSAAVRRCWETRTAIAEDRGDHVVLRPAPDDPVAAALGAFADEVAVLGSDEAQRLDREEDCRSRTRGTDA